MLLIFMAVTSDSGQVEQEALMKPMESESNCRYIKGMARNIVSISVPGGTLTHADCYEMEGAFAALAFNRCLVDSTDDKTDYSTYHCKGPKKP
jgi:hypothetical protein